MSCTWTILDGDGTAYVVPSLFLDGDGTAFDVGIVALDGAGTPYTVGACVTGATATPHHGYGLWPLDFEQPIKLRARGAERERASARCRVAPRAIANSAERTTGTARLVASAPARAAAFTRQHAQAQARLRLDYARIRAQEDDELLILFG